MSAFGAARGGLLSAPPSQRNPLPMYYYYITQMNPIRLRIFVYICVCYGRYTDLKIRTFPDFNHVSLGFCSEILIHMRSITHNISFWILLLFRLLSAKSN